MMNNFAWAAKHFFFISGASQVYFGSLKGCYQRKYYCRECLYSQISLKVWDSEEKLEFSLRLPLRHHIARLGMFSVNPGIVVNFYASAHHPHTTIAIDEWMIFWPSEYSPIEVGSTECSRHLVFESSLHVRLLPATLQWRATSSAPKIGSLESFPHNILIANPKIYTNRPVAFASWRI